jgi:hypothetical protein
MGGIASQDLAMLHYLDIDRTVPAQSAFGNSPIKFPGNDMETETDAEHRETEMQILPGIARTGNVGASAEHEPPAPAGSFIWGHSVWNHLCIDIEVQEHPEDQVVELPEIIHYKYREHSRSVASPG